jgi:hypothetical protein
MSLFELQSFDHGTGRYHAQDQSEDREKLCRVARNVLRLKSWRVVLVSKERPRKPSQARLRAQHYGRQELWPKSFKPRWQWPMRDPVADVST